MATSEKYVFGAKKKLDEFYNDYFANDMVVETYFKEKQVPMDPE